MKVKLRKDAKLSTVKANLIKAMQNRDWAEMCNRPEDTFDVRTTDEWEQSEKRFYDACDEYEWHLARYRIARDREIGPQVIDDTFRIRALGHWGKEQ